MTWQKWVVLAWLALSALVMVGRTGTTRTYTRWDAVAAVIECGLIAWLVVSL